MNTPLRDEAGRWVRDDLALRNGLIALAGIVKRVGCAWELFPDLMPEERRELWDGIYKDITTLTEQLNEVDARKGGKG